MPDLGAQLFMERALQIAHEAAASQLEVIRETAAAVCDAFGSGGRLWAFGTGHSHMMVEEIWGRAGGLTEVHPILEPSLMLHEGLLKSSLLERQSGLAHSLLQIHGVRAGDCLLVASNSGRNAVPVEIAVGAREAGATVIALTSLAHSRSVTSRSPDGRKLFEVAHHVIDNCGVPGDAVLPHDPNPVGATSTIVGALLAQALIVEIIAEAGRRGRDVPTLLSLNA